MSLSAPYATLDEYKAATVKLNDRDDANVLDWLDASTRFWERQCGVLFGLDDEAVVRLLRTEGLYTREGYPYLRLDQDTDGCPGVGNITDLVFKTDTDGDGSFSDETAWTIDVDFQLWPLNADKGAEARPWNKLVIPTTSTKSLPSSGLCRLEARYGWPAVPKLLKLAVIEWTAVMRGESSRATGQANTLDDVVSLSPYHLSIFKRIRESYAMPVIA